MNISKAKEILDYWFSKGVYTPDYDKWFMKSEDYDEEIREKFGDLLKDAEKGKGYGWLVSKDSYVAYIILMDQFSRHIYRGHGDSFKNDNGVMIFVELGFELYREQLKGYEFMFAFMPFMHTESILYQQKGRDFFDRQTAMYGETHYAKRPLSTKKTNYDKEYEMLQSMKPHVNGHFDVIRRFNRFPKRNKALKRETTDSEKYYLEQPEVQKRPY